MQEPHAPNPGLSTGSPMSSKQALREGADSGKCLLFSHPQTSFKNKKIQSSHFKVVLERHMLSVPSK